jgi:hypothetical protein
MRFILELADIISRSKHIVIKGTKYRSQKRSSTQNPKFTDPIPKKIVMKASFFLTSSARSF